MSEQNMNRRDFLKVAGAGAATLAGLRIVRFASASEAHGDSPYSWAMVIDQAKCTGCGRCRNQPLDSEPA